MPAPSVTLTSLAPALTNQPINVTATFSNAVTGFTAAGIVTQGTVSNFRAVNVATYTFTVTPVDQGAVSITIPAGAAQDSQQLGNLAATPLTRTFDSVASGAPVVTGFGSDSGTPNDGITNDTQPTLTGTADVGSLVDVFQGGTLVATRSTNSLGVWTFTPAALANGTYNFTARARDDAGNTSPVSNTLVLRIDTLSPDIPTFTGFSPDTGVQGDRITNTPLPTLSGRAEAGNTVGVFSGTALLGTTTADSNGIWFITPIALADRTYSLTARATDAAGNASVFSTPVTLTIDTVVPIAPIITGFSPDNGTPGDGITNATVLTLTGTAEAGSRIDITAGTRAIGTATANSSGAWTFTNRTVLPDSTYVFTATATDAAGSTSAASNGLTVTIDTVPPATPTITSFVADSGIVGDGITNDGTPTIIGTAEAGVTVQVFQNNIPYGTTTADGTGNWTFTAPFALNPFTYAITARAVDSAGNSSATSNTLAITIDTSTPGAPTIASFSPDTGTPGDRITSNKTPILSGTATAGSTVEVLSGTTSLGTTTATSAGIWTLTATALSDSAYNLIARSRNDAGTVSADSAGFALTIDSTAPPLPTITGFSPDSGVQGDRITNATLLTLTGTAEAGTTVAIFSGNGSGNGSGNNSIGTVTATAAGTWSFTPRTVLASGNYAFSAVATDAAGNSSSSRSFAVTIDTTAPPAPVITEFRTDSGTLGDSITNDSTPTLAGTAEAGSTVTVLQNGTAVGTATVNPLGAWTFTPQAALPEGLFVFTATSLDAAGNASAASNSFGITIARSVAPTPTIASFTPDTGTQGDGITSNNTPTLSGTAPANSTVEIFSGDSRIGTATATSAGTWTATTIALADRAYSLVARVTDAVGNGSFDSAPFALTIDTSISALPTIASFSPDSGVLGDGITNATPALVGTAEAGSRVDVFQNGIPYGNVTADTSGNWTLAAPFPLNDGAYAFTATATDAAGNTTLPSRSLSVTIDTAAPIVPTLASFTPDNGTPNDGITNVTPTLNGTAEPGSTVQVLQNNTIYGSGVIADLNGNWTLAAPFVLNDGAYAFTAVATDAAGNTSPESTALNVTIETVAPIAPTVASFTPDNGTLGDGITNVTPTLNGTAEPGSTVQVFQNNIIYGSGVIADAGGNWTLPAPFALNDGAYAFAARATDAAGNVSSASTALNVTIDSVPPGAVTLASISSNAGIVTGITNDNTPTLAGTADAGINVTVFANGAAIGTTVADSTGTWTLTPTTALADNSYTFTARASDIAGNFSAVSAPLSIAIDTAAPAAATLSGVLNPAGAAVNVTRSGNPTFVGTAEANSSVEVFSGTTSIGRVTADAAGRWTLPYSGTPLPNGVGSFTARATDRAGNVGPASPALALTVDTIAPTPPTLDRINNLASRPGLAINVATPTLSGTAEANSTVAIFAGSAAIGLVQANAQGQWTFRTNALPDASYSFSATATDLAGNVSAASAPASVTIDTVVPTIALTRDPQTSVVDTLTLTFSEAVNGFDLADLRLSRDGVAVDLSRATLTQRDPRTWAVNGLSGLTQTPGSYAFTLVARGSGITDVAGNALTQNAQQLFSVTLASQIFDSVKDEFVAAPALFGFDNSLTGVDFGNAFDKVRGTNGRDDLTGTSRGDFLLGLGANDTIDGGTGSDVIAGSGGDDTLLGRGGADLLIGGTGNDTIDGGIGNDLLFGGAGDDTLTGGGGSNTFTYGNPAEGGDTITDFNTDDRIQVSAQGFGGGLVAGQPLTAAQFRIGSAAAAPTDRFIYNRSTGRLFFDVDGTGSTGAIELARLDPRTNLTAAQIGVV